MVSRKHFTSLLAFVFVLAAFVPANAQTALVDYVGFAYEDGGLDPSNPGDELTVLTTVSTIAPVFGIPAGEEVTIVLSGLISNGSAPSGTTTIITYTGGTLSMYHDPGNDADWGINPPNATAPSTFTNGDLLFQGDFTSFTLFLSASGVGAYEGMLNATGGSALSTVCSDCAYSFAGVFTEATGAQIPDGYDAQVDGTLEVDETVSDDESSFGSFKSQFDQ